jgi:hypothetical protein
MEQMSGRRSRHPPDELSDTNFQDSWQEAAIGAARKGSEAHYQ